MVTGEFMEPAKSEIINGIVHNTALAGSILPDILEYIKVNIADWVGKNVIWNVDAINLADTTSQDIKWFIDCGEKISEIRMGQKTAIVAKNDFHFGMMRMLAMLAEGRFHITLSAFRNLESAMHWVEESPN